MTMSSGCDILLEDLLWCRCMLRLLHDWSVYDVLNQSIQINACDGQFGLRLSPLSTGVVMPDVQLEPVVSCLLHYCRRENAGARTRGRNAGHAGRPRHANRSVTKRDRIGPQQFLRSLSCVTYFSLNILVTEYRSPLIHNLCPVFSTARL
jgi:hypothetical protein